MNHNSWFLEMKKKLTREGNSNPSATDSGGIVIDGCPLKTPHAPNSGSILARPFNVCHPWWEWDHGPGW